MESDPRPFRLDALLAHREWVERAARALVFGDAAAEDLGQQMWLEVLERPPASTPKSPRGWLRSVLRFKAIDAGRAARTRHIHEGAAARDERVADDPAHLVAQAEALDRVVHAVLGLEEPYRTTVLLRFFKDLPPRAIAAMQGIPVETVRTRLKRALAQLRERLDAENEGDRRRWCLAFLPFIQRHPFPEAATSGGATVSMVVGGLLMSGKAKATVAAGVLVLLLGGWFLFPGESAVSQSASRTADPRGVEPAGAGLTGAAGSPVAPALDGSAQAEGGIAGGGRVRGAMVLPPGAEAIVTVIRDGRPVSTRAVGGGDFSLPYARDAGDAASYLLEATGPGWKPQFLPLPFPDSDVGRIRMLQGIRYGGRVEDVEGRPVAGVRVAFLWTYSVMGVASPTGVDGRFAIPLDVETSLPSIPAGSEGTHGLATVLPLMRGKNMKAVPVDPAGFRGEHIIRIESAPGVRIRLVDGESRTPLPGWGVCLKSVLGVGGSTEPVHPVFDSGVTDSEGVYEPLWVDGDTSVVLEARHGARRFVASLDRNTAKAVGTVVIPVPAEEHARTVAIRVLRHDGLAPAAGVEVLVGWRLGRDGPSGSFRSTTDPRGEAAVEVASPEPAPLDPPVVTWGRVAYLADDGRPVMEDMPIGDPQSGLPVSRENPLVVQLGGARFTEVTWFRIQEAETGRDVVPVRLLSSHGTNVRSAYLFRGCGLRDRSGHSLWPATQVPWQGWQGEPIESLRVQVVAEGRAPRWFDVPVAEFIRARTASTPILLEFPRSDGDELEVAVVPVDGKPRAGVVTTLSRVPPGRPAGYWEQAAQCTTDEVGIARFVVTDAEAGATYRVVALDPVTGEAGGIADPHPGHTTLRLEAPQSISFRVTLPDGTAPGSLSLSIQDPCFVLPPLVAKCTPDGRVEIPGIVASLYELRVQGRGPSRPWSDLEPGLVRGGGDPAPPGAHAEAVRTTTWYGLRVPADGVGPVLVLR